MRRERRRKETGKLSALEYHCLEAIRLYREGKLEEAIGVLDGIQFMFGDPSRKKDIGIQQTLGVVNRLQAKWTQELSEGTDDLIENLAVYAAHARELTDEYPARALAIWKGILTLYGTKGWAEDFSKEARLAIEQLKDRVPLDANPNGVLEISQTQPAAGAELASEVIPASVTSAGVAHGKVEGEVSNAN